MKFKVRRAAKGSWCEGMWVIEEQGVDAYVACFGHSSKDKENALLVKRLIEQYMEEGK